MSHTRTNGGRFANATCGLRDASLISDEHYRTGICTFKGTKIGNASSSRHTAGQASVRQKEDVAGEMLAGGAVPDAALAFTGSAHTCRDRRCAPLVAFGCGRSFCSGKCDTQITTSRPLAPARLEPPLPGI